VGDRVRFDGLKEAACDIIAGVYIKEALKAEKDDFLLVVTAY